VLVLQGDDDALSRIGRDRAFLMLVPFQGQSRLRRKAPLAIVIMLATIALAVLNIVSLPLVMVAGAVAVIFAGCLTPNQAYQSIDARIYIFIAGAIPLGAAMQTSGSADLIAQWLQQTMGGWSQFPILITIFIVTALLTQFMSDAATTALFAPLAVSLAQSLGHAPEPYVVTIAMASVAAFLTPIGHHGNLLVYGPGGYRFNDFLKIGIPLTALIAPVVVGISLLLWRA
jgi:di/tricarboxylate transporter